MVTRKIPSPKLVETPSASYDMVGVARVTMQPTHVPLWLGSSRRVVEAAERKRGRLSEFCEHAVS
jgi:hypothetical protein